MTKPTVTQLINLLDKPALLKWANKIGLQGLSLDEYRSKSKAQGVSLHDQTLKYLTKKTPFINPEHQILFDKLMSNKQFIDAEKNISTDFFIGRYDVKLNYLGQNYIADFKSSNGIYFENKLQLAAYKMANPECKIAVIEIPSFIFKPIEIDFVKYELILKCLHKIWQLKQYL